MLLAFPLGSTTWTVTVVTPVGSDLSTKGLRSCLPLRTATRLPLSTTWAVQEIRARAERPPISDDATARSWAQG